MVNRHRAVSMAFNGSWSEDEEKNSLKSLNGLKSIYKDVRYDWPQLNNDATLPIELAIAFLDDTSVGLAHRKPEFDELLEATRQALKVSVVDNHETFNNSVGLYHLLLSIVKESQEDSLYIKELIDKTTRDISDRSHYLRDLDNSSAKYSEMIEILDAMEYLRDIQTVIDTLISEKKIHEVYDVIAEAYKIASKYNLWSLSAMNATRNYLEAQSNNLYDMILEEIQNEIYLKNISIAGDRQEAWDRLLQSKSPQMASLKTLIDLLITLEQYVYNSANLDIFEIAESYTGSAKIFLETQLPKLHAFYTKSDLTKIDYGIILQSTQNPSVESFHYIFMLLLTAFKLNKLQPVLEILSTTVQQEIHALINHTTEEARLKNLHRLSRLAKTRNLETVRAEDKISGQLFNDLSVPILQDLFGSFFLKCVLVLMKHKVACDIVNLLSSNDIVPQSVPKPATISSPLYDFKTVWTAVCKEIEAFMVNYMCEDNEEVMPFKSEISSTNKVRQVMMQRKLFLFDNMSHDQSKMPSDNIRSALQEVFPEFSVNNIKHGSNGNDESLYMSNERTSAMADALVPKNIFNMRIILEFFLIFTAGAQNLFNDFEADKGATIPYQFFQGFMRNSFLRKLKEDLDQSLEDCMSSESDPSGKSEGVKFCQNTVSLSSQEVKSNLPGMRKSATSSIYVNAVRFKKLLFHTCQTLNTSFTYRREISDMVLLLVKNFASAYNEYYSELLSSGGAHDITEMRFGVNDVQNKPILQIKRWMKVPAMLEVTGGILQNHDNKDALAELTEKEIELIFLSADQSSNVFDISKEDLLDDKWFDHVCYLLLSATWVLSWLPSMRKESNYSVYDYSEGNEVSEAERYKHDWTFMENGRSNLAINERAQQDYLTLSLEKIAEFDGCIEIFESVRDNALVALRYDLRLKGLYYIGKSFQDNFKLPTEPSDADQFISVLNKEIYYIGTRINEVLSAEENDCVFAGLPEFLNKALIQGSYLVMVSNNNGIKKILLNLFVLQQMLRSIIKRQGVVDMSHASKYFQLCTTGEHSLMQEITAKTLKYLKSEILNILRLIYSEKLLLGNASSFNKTKYSELVKRINDAFS